MSLPAPFDKFVFNDRLERELRFFIEHPEELPPITCLSGEPGIGKTSFAMTFAKEHSQCKPNYVPMNEVTGGITEKVKNSIRLDDVPYLARAMNAANGRDQVWGQIIILDEFHNLARSKQDYFKTPFDRVRGESELGENDYFRVFICINTDANSRTKSKAEDVLSKPIKDRSHLINFDTNYMEEDAYVEKLAAHYPLLTKTELRAYSPSMRRIILEHRLRSKQTA